MSAQLSRVGPLRSALIVLLCACLSLAALSLSGLARGGEPARDPRVLAAPKTRAPDIGSRDTGASGAAQQTRRTTRSVRRPRTKKCRTASGALLRVPRGLACPRAPGLSGKERTKLREGAVPLIAPQRPNGPSSPNAQPPARTQPAERPDVGGVKAPD